MPGLSSSYVHIFNLQGNTQWRCAHRCAAGAPRAAKNLSKSTHSLQAAGCESVVSRLFLQFLQDQVHAWLEDCTVPDVSWISELTQSLIRVPAWIPTKRI